MVTRAKGDESKRMTDGPRLLLVTDKFAPHPGGTAVIYREWCERLPADRVEVCTSWFPGAEEYDRTCPFPVQRAAYIDIPKLRMPLVWAGIARDAGRAIRKQRPDVLHIGQVIETGVMGRRLAQKHGIPYIVHCYGEEIHFWNRFPVSRRWIREILGGAAAVTCISRYTRDLLRSLALYQGDVEMLYPGTDSSRFQALDSRSVREQHQLGDAPVLLTVARLLPRKWHDRVLEALPALRRRHPGLRYLIVGAGPTEARLREQTAALGLSQEVVFVGSVPHGDVPRYFAAADVFVHPNRQLASGDVEGFGIVFLEAGAAGLPVVGGNSGGTPDAIRDGETGYLVDPNDVGAITDRLTMLLSDPALRTRMGAAGRTWAAGFTWEAAARQVWQMTRRVLGFQGS